FHVLVVHLMLTVLMFFMIRRLPRPTLFPYTTLFRSLGTPHALLVRLDAGARAAHDRATLLAGGGVPRAPRGPGADPGCVQGTPRSEEHTSELQSRENLVCRLLLEKKKEDSSILRL